MEDIREIIAVDELLEFEAQAAAGREFNRGDAEAEETEKEEYKNARKMWDRYGDFDKGDDFELDNEQNNHGNDGKYERTEEGGWHTPGVRYYHGSQTVEASGLRYPNDILDIVYTPLRAEVSGDKVLPFGLKQNSFY